MKKAVLLSLFIISFGILKAQLNNQNLLQSYSEKGFLENKGQIKDFNDRPNKEVKYLYNHGLFNLELKENGFSYELFRAVSDKNRMSEAGDLAKDDESDDFSLRIAGSSRIDVTFEGANRNVEVIASDPTGAYFNFYSSPVITNRIERVNAFNTITYRNIYPGIDVVFSTPDQDEQTPLHYDFVVHPGADPHVIQLKYKGTSDLLVKEGGSLYMNTSAGFVEEGKPVSFLQSGNKEIASAYVLSKNHVSYAIGDYDHSQTMVIDPTLMWGTYYGGEANDEVAKIDMDSKNKPLISGSTLSVHHISTLGAYQIMNGGGKSDLFVAKFKLNGNLDWASYFGGNNQDLAYGIVADPSDNIIITGKVESQGLATIGQLVKSNYGDAIIAKFSGTGIFQWSTYKGDQGDDHFRNVVCDDLGNIYLAGYSSSASNISTPNAFQPVQGGMGDGMIAKYTPAGTLAWCTFFGSTGIDRFHAINIDLYNHILVQGSTGSISGIATPGTAQTVYGGGEEDAMLAEFDTTGNRIWATYYGGEYSDRGRGVETDLAGNIYMVGLTESETNIATPGAHQEHWTEGYYGSNNTRAEDGYIAKFTPDGVRVWGTYYGGSSYDRIWGMDIDRDAHAIYAVGVTLSTDSISSPVGAWQPEKAIGPLSDGLFSRWDYDGNLVWGSYLGNYGEDHIEDVSVDNYGFLYLLTQTFGSTLPVTPGVHQTTGNGNDEAMLYKFHPGINCYDYNEPNEDNNSAKLITASLPLDSNIYGYNGGIANANDQDWFTFKTKTPYPNIKIVLTDLPAKYNLKLYNKQKVLIASSDNPETDDDSIIANGLSYASYYIKISHPSNQFDSVNCYRLKLYKSSTAFSAPVNVNKFSDAGETPLDLKVFPNPATEMLSFDVTSPNEEKSVLMIYDLLGRIAKTEEIKLEKGFQSIEIHVGDLTPGIYKLVMRTEGKNRVAGFVKQ